MAEGQNLYHGFGRGKGKMDKEDKFVAQNRHPDCVVGAPLWKFLVKRVSTFDLCLLAAVISVFTTVIAIVMIKR